MPCLCVSVSCSDDEYNLQGQLFRGYNSLIRPVEAANESIEVQMTLQIILLISINEKEQVMHTNVWITLKWPDFQMRWEPSDYGGIHTIRIPTDKLWLPDLVLFNNADGNYEVSFYSNVVVSNLGEMLWVPPAIYKSSCIIDVEHFPFDTQQCTMNFGSWTYSEKEVQLTFMNPESIDLSDFKRSSIWDIIDCPAQRNNKLNKIEFRVLLRRKPLFYTVVLIIPTMLMGILSVMVFYLPTESGEKITLAISILLSLVVFLLLVSKILPPTSKTIPLMAKYLLLTFVLNVGTIMVTVIVINIHHRRPSTHRLPNWVRFVFLNVLTKLLMMRRPKRMKQYTDIFDRGEANLHRSPSPGAYRARAYRPDDELASTVDPVPSYFTQQHSPGSPPGLGVPGDQAPLLPRTHASRTPRRRAESGDTEPWYLPLTPEACRALEAIEYIAEHLKQDDEYKRISEDWKYVAMVIDRLMLYTFFGVTLGGTLGIIFAAPGIFTDVNQAEVIAEMKAKYGY